MSCQGSTFMFFVQKTRHLMADFETGNKDCGTGRTVPESQELLMLKEMITSATKMMLEDANAKVEKTHGFHLECDYFYTPGTYSNWMMHQTLKSFWVSLARRSVRAVSRGR